MKTEYEARILEIDKKEFMRKIEELGAKKLPTLIKKDMYMILTQ